MYNDFQKYFKNFTKTYNINVNINNVNLFQEVKDILTNKYDPNTAELLTDELIMQFEPGAFEESDFQDYVKNNSLYNILSQAVQSGLIKDSSVLKIINDFSPKYVREYRYITIHMDGQGAIHTNDYFTGKTKYCDEFQFEEFLGLKISNMYVYNISIYQVAKHILSKFMEHFFYYSCKRQDRLKFALNYILPELNTNELDYCTCNKLDSYKTIVSGTTYFYNKNRETHIGLSNIKYDFNEKLTIDELNGIKIENEGSSLPFKTQLKIVYDNIYVKLATKIRQERITFLKTTTIPDPIIENIIAPFI